MNNLSYKRALVTEPTSNNQDINHLMIKRNINMKTYKQLYSSQHCSNSNCPARRKLF